MKKDTIQFEFDFLEIFSEPTKEELEVTYEKRVYKSSEQSKVYPNIKS